MLSGSMCFLCIFNNLRSACVRVIWGFVMSNQQVRNDSSLEKKRERLGVWAELKMSQEPSGLQVLFPVFITRSTAEGFFLALCPGHDWIKVTKSKETRGEWFFFDHWRNTHTHTLQLIPLSCYYYCHPIAILHIFASFAPIHFWMIVYKYIIQTIFVSLSLVNYCHPAI